MKRPIYLISIYIVIIALALTLTACVPKTIDDAVENFKEAEYTIITPETESDNAGKIKSTMFAYTIDFNLTEMHSSIEYCAAIWFETHGDATAYKDRAIYHISKLIPEDISESILDNATIKIEGKCLYFGTEAALKIFK